MSGQPTAAPLSIIKGIPTTPELEYLLQSTGVAILLFERFVIKKDFAVVPRALVEATAAGVKPSDTASLFLSSGSTEWLCGER